MATFRVFLTLTLLMAAPRLWACSTSAWRQFLAEAQTLGGEAEKHGKALSRCRQYRDELVQWLAFHRSMSGNAATAARAVNDVMPPIVTSGNKVYQNILRQAKLGVYQPLQRKIDDAALGYVDDPGAQLTLARALSRVGRFDRARSAYVVYLRLVNEDLAAEAEYLYTYLWEKDFAVAQQKLRDAQRTNPSSPLKEAVSRGLKLVEARHPKAEKPGDIGGGRRLLVPGDYGLKYGMSSIRKKYARQTGTVNYVGPISVAVSQHRIKLTMLDEATTNASQLTMAKNLELTSFLTARALIGYYSPGKEHYFGALAGKARLPYDLDLEVGGYRVPLGLMVPLIKEDQGLMRDAVYLELDWQEGLLTWRSELQKEGDYAAHEFHNVTGRLKIVEGPVKDDFIALKIPLGLEIYPKASPLYPTSPRISKVGFGFDFSRPLWGSDILRLSSGFQLLHLQQRGNRGRSDRVGRWGFGGEYVVNRYKPMQLTIEGFYAKAEREDEARMQEQMNFVSVGIKYLD